MEKRVSETLKRKLLIESAICLALVLFSLYFTRGIWMTRYLGGTDFLGHLAKARFLIDSFKNYSVVHPLWSSEWYAGYPFLQLYAPLSYYFTAILSALVSSDILGAKISVVLSYCVSALSMYWAVRSIFKDRFAAALAAVAFVMFPFHASHTMLEGNMPAAWAIAFSPLSIAAYIRLTDNPTLGNAMLAAAPAALVLLLHISFFWYLALAIVLYSVWRIAFPGKPGERWQETGAQMRNVTGLGLFVFLFTAWWLVPFLVQSRKTLLGEGAGSLAKTFHITKPLSLISHSSISSYSAVYLGLSLLIPIAVVFIFPEFRKNKKATFMVSLSVLSLILAGLYPYLQGYFPFNLLPFSGLVAPLRFLYLTMLALPICFGVASSVPKERIMNSPLAEKQKLQLAALLLVVLLVAVWLDFGAVRDNFAYSLRLSKPYREMVEFIKKDPNYFRFQEIISGSYTSAYTYPLFGHESIEGYHLEGSPTREALALVSYTLVKKQPLDVLVPYLETLAGKYLLVQMDSSIERRVLKTGGFRKAWQNDEYTVLKLKKPVNFAKEVTPVLAVVNPASRQFLLPLQWKGNYKFIFVPGKSHQIDQYLSYDEIKNYPAIFLWGYEYLSTDLERSMFKQYVKNGGTLIICPDGSTDVKQEVFGVRIASSESRGKVNLKYDPSNPVFKNINLAKFSPAFWEGKPWGYTSFSRTKPLLRANGKVVLGTSKESKGEIIWVGFNLPFHAIYYNNAEEIKLLGNIIKWKLRDQSNLKEAHFTKRPYGYIDLDARTKTTKPTWLLVSESNFDGWQATVNSRITPIYTAVPPLMVLQIGNDVEYQIKLRYQPTPWHYAGWAATALSVAFAILYLLIPPFRRWVGGWLLREDSENETAT